MALTVLIVVCLARLLRTQILEQSTSAQVKASSVNFEKQNLSVRGPWLLPCGAQCHACQCCCQKLFILRAQHETRLPTPVNPLLRVSLSQS